MDSEEHIERRLDCRVLSEVAHVSALQVWAEPARPFWMVTQPDGRALPFTLSSTKRYAQEQVTNLVDDPQWDKRGYDNQQRWKAMYRKGYRVVKTGLFSFRVNKKNGGTR